MVLKYKCWDPRKVSRVFTVESEEKADDRLFLKLHKPMSFFLTHEKGTKLPSDRTITEENLFDYLKEGDETLRTVERLIAITGPPGTGKSEVCRWLKIKIRESPVHSTDYMLYITRDKMSPRIFKKYIIDFLSKKGIVVKNIKHEIEKLPKPTRVLANKIISNSLSMLEEQLPKKHQKENHVSFLKFLNENITNISKKLIDIILPSLKRYINFYNEGREIDEEGQTLTTIIDEIQFLRSFSDFKNQSYLKKVFILFRDIIRIQFNNFHKIGEVTISELLNEVQKHCPKKIRPLIIFEDMTTIGIDVTEILDYFTNKARPWDVIFAYTFDLERDVMQNRAHYFDRLDMRLVTTHDDKNAPRFLMYKNEREEFVIRYLDYIRNCKNCLIRICENLGSDSRLYPLNSIFIENIFIALNKKTPREFLKKIQQIIGNSNIPPVNASKTLSSRHVNFYARNATVQEVLEKNTKLRELLKWYGSRSNGKIVLNKEWINVFGISLKSNMFDGSNNVVRIITTESYSQQFQYQLDEKVKEETHEEEKILMSPEIKEAIDNIIDFRKGVTGLLASVEKRLAAAIYDFSKAFDIDMDAVIQNPFCPESATMIFEDKRNDISPRIFLANPGNIQRRTYPHYNISQDELLYGTVIEFLMDFSLVKARKVDVADFLAKKSKSNGSDIASLVATLKIHQHDYRRAALKIFTSKFGIFKDLLMAVKYLMTKAMQPEWDTTKILGSDLVELKEFYLQFKPNKIKNSLIQNIAENCIELFKTLHFGNRSIHKIEFWDRLFKTAFYASSRVFDNIQKYQNEQELERITNSVLTNRLLKLDLSKDTNKTEKYIVIASTKVPRNIKSTPHVAFVELISPIVSLTKSLYSLKASYKELEDEKNIIETLLNFIKQNNQKQEIKDALQTLKYKSNDIKTLLKFRNDINNLLSKIDNVDLTRIQQTLFELNEGLNKLTSSSAKLFTQFLNVISLIRFYSSEDYQFVESLYELTVRLRDDVSLDKLSSDDVTFDYEITQLETACETYKIKLEKLWRYLHE